MTFKCIERIYDIINGINLPNANSVSFICYRHKSNGMGVRVLKMF